MPASMAATASGVSGLLMSTPVTSPTKTGWIWRIESGMPLSSGRVGLVPSIPAAIDRDNPFRAVARLSGTRGSRIDAAGLAGRQPTSQHLCFGALTIRHREGLDANVVAGGWVGEGLAERLCARKLGRRPGPQ